MDSGQISKTSKRSPSKTTQAPIAHGVGRRKSAVARVWLRRGKGDVLVNGKPLAHYFDTEVTRLAALGSLKITPVGQNYTVEANIHGGGLSAQADALRLGIARALLATNDTLRQTLRKQGFLTVDQRVKERKKYGQKAARRKFQFVKR